MTFDGNAGRLVLARMPRLQNVTRQRDEQNFMASFFGRNIVRQHGQSLSSTTRDATSFMPPLFPHLLLQYR